MSILNWFRQAGGVVNQGEKRKSCKFHHWEIYDKTNRYKIKPGGRMSYLTDRGGLDIFNKVKKRCQHEGCNARKDEWVKVNNVRGYKYISQAQKIINELCNLGK